jgi:SNF2 family DNA or RNA helicase
MKDYHFKVKTKPYQHQIDGFHKCYPLSAFAEFMEQGTGKTKLAIDIACNLFQEKKLDAVMVIAPNGVHLQWNDEELPKHSSLPYDSYVWTNKKTAGEMKKRRAFFDRGIGPIKWFMVNVEAFSTPNNMRIFQEYVKKHNTFVIVDESTRIKNPAANRTINIIYNLAQVKKIGNRVIDVIPYSKYRAILTGTMITNSPYDLWSMFEFLQHNYFGINFYAFKARYGIEVRDTAPGTGQIFNRKIRLDEIQSIRRYASQGKHVETIAALMSTSESSVQYIIDHPNLMAPYKRLDELKEKIAPLSFIVRKEDCLDLPPKVYEKLYVYMNIEQKRIYKELKNQYITMYQKKDLSVQNKLTLVGRLQQITGGFFPYEESGKPQIIPITNKNPKIEYLKKDLEETGNEVIIIWARFVGELKMLHSELSKTFPEKCIELYYGGVTGTRRQIIINAFKEGKVNILIANARTAGVGLNLQKAHLQYFFSNSYSLEDRAQAEDRSHRSGQEHSVLYKDIIMKDTVDEAVLDVLQTKKNLLDYFRSKSLAEFLG